MIIGIGSDIAMRAASPRSSSAMATVSSTASSRTPNAARPTSRRNRLETYAKRFAAKEACAKALGTGLRAGVWWRDIGVINLPSGRPTLQLTGGALQRLAAMTPAGYEARIDLTITDEGPTAQAFVVISAVRDLGSLTRVA